MSSYPEQTSLSDLLSQLKTLNLNQGSQNLDNMDFQDIFNILKEEGDFEFNEAELLFVLDFASKFNYSLYKSNIITGESRRVSREVETIISYQWNNLKFVEYAIEFLKDKPCCKPPKITTDCRQCGKKTQQIIKAFESNDFNSLLKILKSESEEAFSEENKISEDQWKSYKSTMENIWEEKGI